MLSKIHRRALVVLLLCTALACGKERIVPAGFWLQTAAAGTGQIDVTVMDQNGQPLSLVIVILQQSNTQQDIFQQNNAQQNDKVIARERTTPSGNAVLRQLMPGTYKLLIEKQGFYTTVVAKVEIIPGPAIPVEVRLQPVREYREEIEVTAQPSPIDPEQSASSQSITTADISAIPYHTVRDYRGVLAYIPGVVADSSGQIHVAGSSTQEVQDYMDGFEVSQPATGSLAVRMNPDSLHKIEVRSSRYSSQFGKGSGGVTDLEVQDGDNHIRMNATDLFPTLQRVHGFHLNNWTPRGYISGPVVKDKIWFNLSHEGEKDLNIIKQLPEGANSNPVWRTADLARLRMNLTPGNVLTASALLDLFDSDNAGISPFDPLSVSFNQHSTLYVATLKDQLTLAKSTLLEFGAGFHWTRNSLLPLGNSPYVFTPTGRLGNYYQNNRNWSDRSQAFSNLFLKPWKWAGTHQFTLGGRVDRVVYHAQISRGAFEFVDANNILLRQVTFQNALPFGLGTTESSAYVQDRWSAHERLVVEAGGRWDHDGFLSKSLFSPRIAGSVLVARASETKFTAGVGVYYDRTNLALASQAVQGSRTDVFLSPTAQAITVSFLVDPTRLPMPKFTNWSLGLERRLPGRIYARLDFLSRHGANGWAYEGQPNGVFQLGNNKRDRYDAAQITLRKELKRGYPFMISYTRSQARSNESVDFSLDNFTTGTQVGGPLAWDAPNLVNAWGSTPLFWKLKKFDFACSMLWHSGFPFITIDQFGRLVAGPSAHRFPDYFTLNPAIERKFVFRGYRWAARVGLDDATDRQNATVVDNNINSPSFLAFFGTSHRTINGRIRFLGKK